jgi:NNP family nitrate/nitrite transporter-like MFS transporter
MLCMRIRELSRSGHAPSLVAALAYFDVSFMVWVLLGALGPFVARDLHLSPAQKGLMVAVPALGGAAFRLLFGSTVDRIGLKRAGKLGLGLTLIPLAWAAVAGTTYAQMLSIGVLLGIAGGSFAVALPLASRWYPPEQQGLVLGIVGAGNSGTIVAALVAPRVAQHLGWHATFALTIAPVAIVWVLFAALAKEPPARAASAQSRSALGMLIEGDARWLCAFYLVTFGGFVGLTGYLPIFYVDRFGLTPVSAASYAALCAVAGSLLRPIGGAVADRVGGTKVLVGALTAIAVLGGLLAAEPGLAATVGLLFALVGAFGVGNGAVFQLVGCRYPREVGPVTGLVGAAGGVGGFLLVSGFGWLAGTTGTFGTGFALLAVIAAGTAFAAHTRTHTWRSVRIAAPDMTPEVAV